MLKLSIKLLILTITFSAYAFSAPNKVTVRGVPKDIKLIGKTKCIAPYVCKKKDESGLYSYNAKVWGNPKFYQGELTLRDGSVLKGEIAVHNFKQDWGFVKHFALFIPENENEAWFVGEGDAHLIKQVKKKKTLFYDMYGSVYLERLVSGKLRLSFNPAAGTNKKITDFIPSTIIDSAERQVRGRAALAALKDGKSFNDAIKDGQDASAVVTKIVASIEITEKEYLIFDETKGTTTLVLKDNYKQTLQALFSQCSDADSKKLKSFKSYKKIKKAINYINTTCPQ